ncbi:MAG: hydrolase [Oscillospiraceae bacterium]|jgi:hypothetical protein|nr:hydrolase [Oscillospiraceae bacterium]
MIELNIQHGGTIYTPIAEEGVTLEWERKGSPGKLSFTAMKDPTLNFTEGDSVSLRADGRGLFYGFVFTKQRDKEHRIKVTAYDQMRYLKNKDTYVYKNKTATELVRMIAEDFRLSVGTLEDTKYKIPKKAEQGRTLVDIIQSALDETLFQRGKMYVLYDDFGALSLRAVESLALDLIIDDESGANFDYTSSIDSDTYNRIKLTYDNEETGTRDVYAAQDGGNINRWGVLQYYDVITNPALGKLKADGLLALYNAKTRNLTVQNTFGDPRVRAGSTVIVRLELGDITVGSRMMVERVKHTFAFDEHTMDLTLIGGEFVV